MVNELRPTLTAFTVFCLAVNIVAGMRLPVRERQLPLGTGIHPLEHRIGDVLQKISSSAKVIPRSVDATTPPPAVVPVIPDSLRSDIRAAIFVLRETQLQILSVLSVQIKIQEKLSHWQLAPHQTKIDASQTNDNFLVPSELRTDAHKINSVEHQMAHLLQRISSTSSNIQGWPKTARLNKASSNNDNKDPWLLYSAIKEAASVFQETQVQISSILSVQADIQQSLDYWQVELVKLLSPENVADDAEENTTNPSANLPCYPNDTESKSSWLLKAFVCHSPLHATFWINSGANWYWRSNNNGQTALQLAVSRNWRSVVELLFKRGADCRVQSSQQEETLLHQAVRDGVEAPLVRLLISAGCEVNATDGLHKQTALHLAAEMGRKDLADLLVRNGRANIEAQDQMGFRPLHSAVRSPQIVTMLIASGADIGATTVTGMTPLHLAVTENQMATVRILVKAGAKVGNAFDVYGHTPLDYAALLADYEMRTLLAPYASIDEYFLDMPSE
ncbi:serine/threonine-protein phosphatase 6 regulatory ankyrin repeat subunit A [Daphnia magna]|uniref:serine/threonine-protein phosphatase 6 regulatory ankyrin repeat subunit A n=1 Tax=Daphnia magna TaxID=35525 RepID=UPI001E1BA83B|nr:serine/threonine-protein phosphatase 6 regulatory ankyrin repeat subunit A [Daphnia magna]